MRISLSFAAIGTAFALSASTASAAPPPNAAIHQFGKCAAQNYDGAELLATQPGSPEEAEVLSEFARRACHAPTSEAQILRGAVAEQLFATDFGSIGAQPRRDLIEVFTVDASELLQLDAQARKRIEIVAFGTCVAASDQKMSSDLLKTAAGSPEEKGILTELVPQFAPCLNEGERFDFSRADLRSALAEGAYRLALAQSLDEEVVVTGTRDPSKSVQCKRQDIAGTRFRRNICMTEAQWAERERQTDFTSQDIKRRAQELDEIRTACISQAMFGGPPCLIK